MALKIIKDKRRYIATKAGVQTPYHITYTLNFRDGVLEKVFNENNFSVEPNSDCFQYFKRKYLNQKTLTQNGPNSKNNTNTSNNVRKQV